MIRKIVLVFLIAGFSLGLFSLLSIRLPKNTFDELELSAGAAVVLYGGRLEAREKLPSEMERRIQYASSLLRKGRVEDIIISGGLCSEIEGNKSIQDIARKLQVEKGFYC
ncbi:MAG: hypothetical protein GX817_07535 [Elusimicrobia bacterium]|nr:hypothetical protein [Elusimicrobiota bacterium]